MGDKLYRFRPVNWNIKEYLEQGAYRIQNREREIIRLQTEISTIRAEMSELEKHLVEEQPTDKD